jgi:hypothetical protein
MLRCWSIGVAGSQRPSRLELVAHPDTFGNSRLAAHLRVLGIPPFPTEKEEKKQG